MSRGLGDVYKRQAEERLVLLIDAQVDAAGQPLNEHLRNHVGDLTVEPNGVPVAVVEYNPSEFMARARVVHNIVQDDPNAPTLSEVREMMEEVEAEIAAESGEAL